MSVKDLKFSELCATSAAALELPGSGSVSALIGMLAASMAETAARLTELERDPPAPGLVDTLRQLRALRLDLFDAADRDEAAVTELNNSRGMPAATPIERQFRHLRLVRAAKAAVEVPVYAARLGLEIFPLAEVIAQKGGPEAAAGAVSAAFAARSAVLGCCLSARVRLRSVGDPAYAEAKTAEIREMEREAKTLEMRAVKQNRPLLS